MVLIQSYNKSTYIKKRVILCFIVNTYTIHRRSMWSLSKLLRRSPMRLTLPTTSLVPKVSAIHAASYIQHHDTINFEAYNALRKAYQHSIKQSQLALDSPLLLNVFPKKKILSGLLTLTPEEQRLLNDMTAEGLEFKKYLCVICSKVFFHCNYSKYHSLEIYLTEGLRETFNSFDLSIFSSKLVHIVGDRTVQFIQHFATLLWGYTSFPSTILERICGPHVNIDSYLNTPIKMLTFIELMHIKRLHQLLDFSPNENMISHVINPENLGNTAVYFNELVSKEQTGQKNCDAVITDQQSLSPSTLDQARKWYVDVKTFVTLGVDNQRFALFFPTSIKQIKTYVNNITTSLKRFIDNNKLQHDSYIMERHKEISNITKEINSKSTINSAVEKFNEIMTTLTEIFKGNKYTNLHIGIAIPSSPDIEFIKFLETELKAHLEQLQKNPEDFRDIFPNNSTIDENNVEEFIVKFVKELFPNEEMQKAILYTREIGKTVPAITWY